MTHVPMFSQRRRMAALAAAFGLAVLAAPAAHAFTLDNQSNSNADGSAKFYDPDDRLQSRFGGTNDGRTVRDGNTGLQFGTSGNGRMSDEAVKNQMFDPLGRPGDR